MDTQEIQQDIKLIKLSIKPHEVRLGALREQLARAKTQLVEIIAAESKKLRLVNGDYGKMGSSKWLFIGRKTYWWNGVASEFNEGYFVDSRKGNIFAEMEDAKDGKDG